MFQNSEVAKQYLKIAAVSLVLLAIVGWVDSDISAPTPKYQIICDNQEVTQTCVIIDKDGKYISELSIEEATEENMFSNPKNIEAWVGK